MPPPARFHAGPYRRKVASLGHQKGRTHARRPAACHRAACRHPRDRRHQHRAGTLCHADVGRPGRRRDQGGKPARRRHALDRTVAHTWHGQLLRQPEPQQAQRRAGPEAIGGKDRAAAADRWRRRVRAQHAPRRGETAGSGLSHLGGAQSVADPRQCLRLPSRQRARRIPGVRRPDPGHERPRVAERRPGRRTALCAHGAGGQADRPDAGLDDRHGPVPPAAHRPRPGSARADAGNHSVLPSGRALVVGHAGRAGPRCRLPAHDDAASPAVSRPRTDSSA